MASIEFSKTTNAPKKQTNREPEKEMLHFKSPV